MNNKKDTVFACIGASNHSKYPREANDYYSTDPLAITLLHKHNLLDNNVDYWECAVGGGGFNKRAS